MTFRNFLSLVVLMLPLALFAATQQEAEQALQAAEAAYADAADVGKPWLRTQSLIDQAREALQNGEYDRALELARQARAEGETAAEQSRYQAEHWQENIPYTW